MSSGREKAVVNVTTLFMGWIVRPYTLSVNELGNDGF